MDTTLFNFDFKVKNKGFSFFAKLPKGIDQKEKLLSALSHCLELPDHFGMNWDAFEDCLHDFNWVNKKTVILFHEDVPLMNAKDDQLVYLEILLGAIQTWKNSPKHEFIVSFPAASKSYLNSL